MKTLIEMVQEEINQLMQSKLAKKTDTQLWAYDTMKTPYELAIKMYEDYINEQLSMKDVAKRYGITPNGVNKAFKSYKLKTRTCREGQLKNVDSKENDIKNGMGVTEFCLKYKTTKNTYYRYKKNIKKDLAV
jgi:hypothetical protein